MTTEGWLDIMDNGIDSRGIELQPKYNHRVYISLYFIAFILFGSMIIINLFTATIVDNFNKIKEREEIGYGLIVTKSQKQWIEVQTICLRNNLIFKSRPPVNKFRRICYDIVTSVYFDILITVVILLNTVIMAMKYARMSDTYELTLDIFNYFFLFLYNVEFVLKLIGIGKRYFTEFDFNLFDFICVLASDISMILSFVTSGSFQSLVLFMRAFRVIKILRLFQTFGKLIITTLIYAIPQMRNVLLLLLLLLFIFAALGLNLFSPVMYKETYNSQNSFRNIFDSIILLMR